MSIPPSHPEGNGTPEPPLSRGRLLGSNPPDPLTGDEIVALLEAAGLSCGEGFDWADRIGLTKLKIVLAYFAYELVFEEVKVGSERVAGLVGGSASRIEKHRAQIPDEYLAYDGGSWSTAFSAKTASGPRDDGGLQDLAKGPLHDPAIARGSTPPLQDPANDVVATCYVPTPIQDPDKRRTPQSLDRDFGGFARPPARGGVSPADPGGDGDDRKEDQTPARARETREDESEEDGLPDGAEEAPERVSPEVLGYHRGEPLMAGQNEFGPYLLWPHPLLIEWTDSKFRDAPGALEMETVEAVAEVEAAVEAAAFQKLCEATVLLEIGGLEAERRAELEKVAADAPAVVEALRPSRTEEGDPEDYGTPAEWLVETGVLDEVPPPPPAPSEDDLAWLREIAARYRDPVPAQVERWIAGGPTGREVRELADRLLHRWVKAGERGQEPQLESLDVVLAEMEGAAA